MATKQINQYTAAISIDSSADYFLIDPGGTGAYKKINLATTTGITGSVVGTTDTQNLTNKTLNNTNSLTIKDGSLTLQNTSSTTKQAVFSLASVTAGQTRTITVPDSNTTLPIASQVLTFSGPTNARTYTLPDAATTLAGIATAQTLTNKTITDPTNVLGPVTMTLGSDADGDIYYRSSGVLTRLAKGTAGQTLVMNGGATAPSWGSSTSQVTLLKANSGTDTNSGATNVDTFALTGLTAKDSLYLIFSCSSLTQNTASIQFYSSTDNSQICFLNGSGIVTAGFTYTGSGYIRQSQQSSTVYDSVFMGGLIATAGGSGSPTNPNSGGSTSMSTAWTGSWTIAFRHGGVTSGGTFRWSWSLYKVAGQ